MLVEIVVKLLQLMLLKLTFFFMTRARVFKMPGEKAAQIFLEKVMHFELIYFISLFSGSA